MAALSYADILEQAQQLPPEEQRQLANALMKLVNASDADLAPPRRSILELDGLGKEIWAGVDPDQYLAEERHSWDG
jgi:hypothetical protein